MVRLIKRKILYLNVGQRKYKHIELLLDITPVLTRSRYRQLTSSGTDSNATIIDLAHEDNDLDNSGEMPLKEVELNRSLLRARLTD